MYITISLVKTKLTKLFVMDVDFVWNMWGWDWVTFQVFINLGGAKWYWISCNTEESDFATCITDAVDNMKSIFECQMKNMIEKLASNAEGIRTNKKECVIIVKPVDKQDILQSNLELKDCGYSEIKCKSSKYEE